MITNIFGNRSCSSCSHMPFQSDATIQDLTEIIWRTQNPKLFILLLRKLSDAQNGNVKFNHHPNRSFRYNNGKSYFLVLPKLLNLIHYICPDIQQILCSLFPITLLEDIEYLLQAKNKSIRDLIWSSNWPVYYNACTKLDIQGEEPPEVSWNNKLSIKGTKKYFLDAWATGLQEKSL